MTIHGEKREPGIFVQPPHPLQVPHDVNVTEHLGGRYPVSFLQRHTEAENN